MDPSTGPDVVEQIPAGGNPMQPESGTYGAKASTDRLKQQLNLPGGETSSPPTKPTSMQPGQPQGQGVPASPSGVPDVLMRPTTQPDVPPSTPLSPAASQQFPGAVNAAQRRVAGLQALVDSPNVSAELKEWAQVVLDKLTRR